MAGIDGEKLFLTGVTRLRMRAEELNVLYDRLPEKRGVKDSVILDAYSSAIIEGERTADTVK